MGKLGELLSMARQYYEELVEAYNDYVRGRERIYAVERLAQLLSQCILDYAAVLAAREKGVKPSTYRELARWLAKRIGLSSELEEFLEGLAGFRSILVHGYARLDKRLEEKAFQEILREAPRVLEALEAVAVDPSLEDVRRAVAGLAREYGIALAFVFGSIARRGYGRDVDLAIKLRRRPRSALELGRIQVALEDKLGAPVDLVLLDGEVPPALAKTIVDEAVLVYGDPGEAEEELLRLYKIYLDAASAHPS